VKFAAAELREKFWEFCVEFCCQRAKPRLEPWKFSTIVLGGTAALHAYRAWGAVIFWGTNAFFFVLARNHGLARLARGRKMLNAERRTPNA
jgi:hypothetical protein